jgi:phosphate acetyltransferase
MRDQNYNVGFIKPISQIYDQDQGTEHSTSLVRKVFGLNVPECISLNRAEHLLSMGKSQELMEEVVESFSQVASDADVVIVEGMVSSSRLFYSKRLNALMIRALDADIILVSSPHHKSPSELREALEIEKRDYMDSYQANVAGCIVNKVGRLSVEEEMEETIKHTKVRHFGMGSADDSVQMEVAAYEKVIKQSKINQVAVIPWLQDLIHPTLQDLAGYLKAHAQRKGEWTTRKVESIALCSMSLSKSLYFMQDGALILATSDRSDIILAAAMATTNGVKLAGVLLCGRYEPDPNTLILCEKAFQMGLPLLTISTNIYHVATRIGRYAKEISLDDQERAEEVMKSIAGFVDTEWIGSELQQTREHRISPPEFRNLLIKLARRQKQRIVLPEGEESRTVRAAIICHERQIANPVLLGRREVVNEVARKQGLEMPAEIEVLDPAEIASRYIDSLLALRKHKGLTREEAEKLLEDEIYVGTMMLKHGEVDGLVSGAVHSTADTVKPAMQIIKTKPGTSLISSIFFMCLPNQVLVYGDCAINQDPTAEQLAQIADQSANSAAAFRIPQRVAMISYSTGSSGFGAEVEKVREATALLKKTRPDLCVDGPLQYDAATTPSVAATKAPNSEVAGNATVLVFPDLNTGNTTYKAVQRSANLVSIGPMLQGLAKPVNDLSRGALVDDIVYTIALTAIQAQEE